MKRILLFLLLSFCIIGCQDDNQGTTSPENSVAQNDAIFMAGFGAKVKHNFIGKIVDENNFAIGNADVTIGGITVKTDWNGIFVINEAEVYEDFAHIKASKTGYILGSRSLKPSAGVNEVRIKLLKKNIVKIIQSGEVSEASLSNGAKVKFQGDFVDAQGNPYSGAVQVSVHYLKPNSEETFERMPGMLFAQDQNNNARTLETYGMLAVNLYGGSGETLNIKSDSPATLEFPVDQSTPNAPSTIKLWYFDEATGYWKEEGVAQRSGNKYIAEVKHFTWWNCDEPIELVDGCLTINSQFPLAHEKVEIIRNTTGQMLFTGNVNTLAQYCGKIPKGEQLTLKVYSQCNNDVVHEEVLGPYLADFSSTITVNPATGVNHTMITGTINTCAGQALNNGFAKINKLDAGGNIEISKEVSIMNGQLNYNMIYCDNSTYTIQVYDYYGGQSTVVMPLNMTSATTNLGVLSTCEAVASNFKLYHKNGVEIVNGSEITCTSLTPPDSYLYFKVENTAATAIKTRLKCVSIINNSETKFEVSYGPMHTVAVYEGGWYPDSGFEINVNQTTSGWDYLRYWEAGTGASYPIKYTFHLYQVDNLNNTIGAPIAFTYSYNPN